MSKSFLSLLSLLALLLPCHAGVIVIGKLARTSNLRPGEAFDGVIQLRNEDSKPADVRLSQTDYVCNADGTTSYGEPGQQPRSNASWITVSPTRLKLAPGETQPVRYKGRAPLDPKLHGTYWSVIMAEPSSAPGITPEGKPNTVAVGLQTTIRFAVQIVTEVGQVGVSSLKIADKALVYEEGKRALLLDISNDGERLLIPAISVELFDEKGASAGKFPAGRTRLYPASSARAKADLTGVRPGKYTAMVLLDSGDAQVMGAQYDLELAAVSRP